MDETTKAYYDLINRQQQANNEWSAQQAQKAMDYQTEMSNTAHQREVKDLIAAGLNPILSAGGSGATTGSGIAASAGNENVSALYGLAKQAIDANMKQAEAMANQAKSVADASSASSGKGSGSGSGSKNTVDDSTAQSIKSVWDQIIEGDLKGAVLNGLDLSDMPEGGKLAICAALHKVFPFLSTNQIYKFMEDYHIWNLPDSASIHPVTDIIQTVGNSANGILGSALSEVGNQVYGIIRDNLPSTSSNQIVGSVQKKEKKKKETWFDRITSKRSPSTRSKSSPTKY